MKLWPSTCARNWRSNRAVPLTVVTGRSGAPAGRAPRSSSCFMAICFRAGSTYSMYTPSSYRRYVVVPSSAWVLRATAPSLWDGDANLKQGSLDVPGVGIPRLRAVLAGWADVHQAIVDERRRGVVQHAHHRQVFGDVLDDLAHDRDALPLRDRHEVPVHQRL